MENKITGKVVHISAVETVGAKNTPKQTMVVEETGEKYPQSVAIDALKDGVEQLSGIKEGDELTAYFNLRSREYNGRWFQNVNLWKVEKSSAVKQQAEPVQPSQDEDDGSDGLPF